MFHSFWESLNDKSKDAYKFNLNGKKLPLTGLEPLTLLLYYFQSQAYPIVLIPIAWKTET